MECQRWYHIQCEGVDVARYRKMQEEEKEPWFCRKSVQYMKKHVEAVKRLKEEKEGLMTEQRML